MRGTFADSVYWVALAHDRDQWHERAIRATRVLVGSTIVTTEDIFDEFLAHFSERGPALRRHAVGIVEDTLADPAVLVIPQSHQSFLDGLALYKARPDKGYSLTDCISMVVMRREGIAEILTHDAHFTQEGFTILL